MHSGIPPVEIDFDIPRPPGVNGDICQLPEPGMMTTPPWSKCKRWKPLEVEEEGEMEVEEEIAEEFMHIDPKILYISLFLIIAFGLLANLTQGQIYSIVAVLLIILIAIANIGYLYQRFKG